MKARHFETAVAVGRLKRVTEYVDLAVKILSAAALIAAGLWSYFQFRIGGSQDWMNNMSIQAQVLPYQEKLRLVVVHVRSKNPRFVQAELTKEHDSFKLIVHKIPDDLKSGAVMQEDDGPVLKTVDLLPDDGLQLSPNAEFDDMATFVLPVGIAVNITAVMEVANGSKTKDGKQDSDFVHVSTVLRIEP